MMKQDPDRDQFVLSLFSTYLENGSKLPAAQVARAAQLVGYEVSPNTVIRILRSNGYTPGKPGRKSNLLLEVGEARIREVGEMYMRGDLILKQAAAALNSSEPTVNRWFSYFGLSRRGAR